MLYNLLTMLGLLLTVAAVLSLVGGTYVKELDDSFIEKSQEGLWLVEFYAPWCGHCKRLEPIFEAVAKRLQPTPITVGRIDCTLYSYAASHFSVRGFPTIQFFLGNQSHTHRGDRTERDIIDFVNKAQGPPVRTMSSVGRFKEEQTERGDDVFFVYVGDDDPDNDLLIKYTELAQEYRLQSFFYKGSKKILPRNVEVETEPTVLVFKQGQVLQFKGLGDVTTTEDLRDWVSFERFPAFPEAGGGVINEMARTGRMLVMVVVDLGRDDLKADSQRIKQIAETIATQQRDKYRTKFHFLWFEEADIANNIAMTTLDLPAILVLDPGQHIHYVASEDTIQSMTEETLVGFLDDVIDGKLEASGGTGFLQRVKRVLYDIYSFFASVWQASRIVFFLIICIPSFIVGLLVWSLCCMESSDEPLVDEDGEPIEQTPGNDATETKALPDSETQGESEDVTTDHAKSE